jgi:hypothetical protein
LHLYEFNFRPTHGQIDKLRDELHRLKTFMRRLVRLTPQESHQAVITWARTEELPDIEDQQHLNGRQEDVLIRQSVYQASAAETGPGRQMSADFGGFEMTMDGTNGEDGLQTDFDAIRMSPYQTQHPHMEPDRDVNQ